MKAFELLALVGPVHPASAVGNLTQGRLPLSIFGETRQTGDLNQLVWKMPEVFPYLPDCFEPAAGDVILSGTPSGAGPGNRGGLVEVACAGPGRMAAKVV